MVKQQPIIITMVCNKGGVGRSTTTINIAWKLAELGMKTLVVDLDAQCNTSMTLAVDYIMEVAKSTKNLTNCIADERGTFWAYKTETRHSNLDLLGATILLDETEENMKSQPIPTHILQSKLDSEDIWALDARRIMDMVVDSIRRLNEKLKPLPVLLTKYRSNVIQCQVMRQTCEEEFSNLAGVFKNDIRLTTQIGRSEAKRQSIYEYGRNEKVATDYTEITKELLSFCIGDKKTDALFDSKKTLKKRS